MSCPIWLPGFRGRGAGGGILQAFRSLSPGVLSPIPFQAPGASPLFPHGVPTKRPSAPRPGQPRLLLQVNTIPASFHDGLLLYVQAVTETLAQGGTFTDGEAITQRMWNRSFQGQPEAAGTIHLGAPQARGHETPACRCGVTRPCQSFPLYCKEALHPTPGPPSPSAQLRREVLLRARPHSFPPSCCCYYM